MYAPLPIASAFGAQCKPSVVFVDCLPWDVIWREKGIHKTHNPPTRAPTRTRSSPSSLSTLATRATSRRHHCCSSSLLEIRKTSIGRTCMVALAPRPIPYYFWTPVITHSKSLSTTRVAFQLPFAEQPPLFNHRRTCCDSPSTPTVAPAHETQQSLPRPRLPPSN
jgi:hypothetical protein